MSHSQIRTRLETSMHSLAAQSRRILSKLRSRNEYRDMYRIADGREVPDRRVAVVFGNCQAKPLSALLRNHRVFSEHYHVVSVPPVHEIADAQVPALHSLINKSSVLIAQEVKNGYRGLEVGTTELRGRIGDAGSLLTYPVFYYEGLYPFQVYVRLSGDVSEQAPITGYADLRTIYAAHQSWDVQKAWGWFRDFEVSARVIADNSEKSLRELERRESTLSVKGGSADMRSHLSESVLFHTVNHPSNRLLELQASRILRSLAVVSGEEPKFSNTIEVIGDILTPVDGRVPAALGLGWKTETEWGVRGRKIGVETVFKAQFEWLRARPALIDSAMLQHSSRVASILLQ